MKIDLIKLFLDILFDDGDYVCVSPNKYAYFSVNKEYLFNCFKDDQNISLKNTYNNIQKYKPSEIELACFNAIKKDTSRADANVLKLRTFLIEIDNLTLDKQIEYIKQFKIPYSIAIFSGNKSIHLAISLKEDLPSEYLWRHLNQWILNILTEADQQNKNPTKNIRFPYHLRNGVKEQTPISLKDRISYDELINWLSKHPDKEPKQEIDQARIHRSINGIPTWIIKELQEGIDISKGRNNRWYSISLQFAKLGFDAQEIEDTLSEYFTPEHDFTRKEWSTIVKSAYRHNKQYINKE